MPASAGTFAGFGQWRRSGTRLLDVHFHFIADHIYIDYFRAGWMLCLPASAFTYKGFRAWAASGAYPERGRISYLADEVYIDMSPEEIETHNKVKEVVSRVIGHLNAELDLGQFYADGVQLDDDPVGLETVADGAFASWEAFASGRLRLVARRRHRGQYVRLSGAPDWVLEVVSYSSVDKDTRLLRRLYYRAGIPEYWLIDARDEEVIRFQILVRGVNRYVAVKPREGWHASPVFRREFRLERRRDRMGLWRYTLHHRPV